MSLVLGSTEIDVKNKKLIGQIIGVGTLLLSFTYMYTYPGLEKFMRV
jgi:hypothetical protein